MTLRTLRGDARCCGGGGADRKDLLIKGLALFFLCSVTLQYLMNAFLTHKHTLQRIPLSASGASGSDRTILRNYTIARTPLSSALRTKVPKSPTPRTLAVPLHSPNQQDSTLDTLHSTPDSVLSAADHSRNNTDRTSVPHPSHSGHAATKPLQALPPVPPEVPLVVKTDKKHGDSPPLPVLVVNHADLQKAADEVTPSPESIEIPPSLLNVTEKDSESSYCPRKPPNLVGEIPVTFDMPTLSEMEEELPEVMKGGRWRPKGCKPRHRVAIIIPYRDREEHLRIFLAHIHPFLQKQLIEYGIYIVEQNPKSRFNRAMLMNIGFMEALKLHQYDCCIFHDVDLLPEDDRNLYICPTTPRHMSAAVDTFGYRLPYDAIFGGITALTVSQFRMVNGFSNMFFGWGGEDDDMYNRVKYHKLVVRRYPMHIARYRMIRHLKDSPSPERLDYLKTGRSRYRSDGLNGLKYKLRWVQEKKLFTWIMVDLDEKEVLQMYPQPEVKTVMPLDQAEGDGNEARRKMKDKEEKEAEFGMRNNSSQFQRVVTRFDIDTYSDDGQDIKGGLTILSAEDVRRAKARLNAQLKKKMEKLKNVKLFKSQGLQTR